MIELVFLFLVFGGIALVRTVREAAKLEQNRPRAGTTPDESSVDGKSIFDVLEEIRREREPVPELDDHEFDSPEGVHPKMRRWIYPGQEVVRTQIPRPPPPSSPPAPVPPIVSNVLDKPEFPHGKYKKAYVNTGLSHPVFKMDGLTSSEMAQRAIVLREVLGPPVGLR